MELSQAEIDRYAPYHTFPEFELGFDAYVAGLVPAFDIPGVAGQAYDRGGECAMRRQMTELRKQA